MHENKEGLKKWCNLLKTSEERFGIWQVKKPNKILFILESDSLDRLKPGHLLPENDRE